MSRRLAGSLIFALILAFIALAAASAQTAAADAEFIEAVKLHQAGDLEGAIRAYRSYLSTHPASIQVLSNLGAVFSRQGRYQDAIEQYQQALEVAENPIIRFNLGLAYYQSSQISRAAAEFGKVIEAQPENRNASILLADCALRTGDNKRVIALLEAHENAEPSDAALDYLLGTALIRENQVDKGQKLIDRILSKGDSAEAHIMLGTAHLMGRDYPSAVKEFARAVELNAKLPLAHSLYGRASLATGDRKTAMEAFRAELKLNPNDYEATLYVGVLLKQDQNYDEALVYFQRALEIRPGAPDARYQIGSLYVSAGKVSEAQRILEELTRESPDFVEAHVSLATVYYRQKRKEDGDRERAIVDRLNATLQSRSAGTEKPAFEGAEAAASPVQGAREAFDSVSRRADAARETGKTDEALELYRQALRLEPDSAESLWYLGTLFYEKDQYAEAQPVFAKLTALKPKGGAGWALLGLCEFRLEQYAEAAEHLDRARVLGLVPKSRLSVVARYHLALLLNRFGQPELATQYLFALARQEPESSTIVEALGLSGLGLPYLPSELPAEKRDLVTKVGWAEYYLAQRNVAEGSKRFAEILAAHPGEPGVHYAHGVLLLGSNPDQALEEFRQELKISPTHLNARLQIAFEYIKRAEYGSGLLYAEEAIQLAPASFAAHNALGRILLEVGETNRAIEELETAAKLAPDSPETIYALARAYTRAGRKQDADRARAEFDRLDKLRRGLREGHGADGEAPPRKPPPG
jgi:tetratricopeptide (TPR) repeat protein